jgi:signal peptidase I
MFESQIQSQEEKKSIFDRLPSWLLFLIDLIKVVVIAFVIVWPIHHWVMQPFLVSGPSMEPNFYDREYLIVEEISYHFSNPQRGEVVVFRSPQNHNSWLIKRVIGLPKERIVIQGGDVFIYNEKNKDGVKLKEDYLFPGLRTGGSIDIVLKDDEYYLLGDNRNLSLDSRVFGPVQRKLILGKVWLRAWPIARAAKFSFPIYENL